MKKQSAITMLTALMLLGAVATAHAQDKPDYIAEAPVTKADERGPGWYPMLKASANLAFSHNKNVVGSADGATWNIGTMVAGGLDWLSVDGHEWNNSLTWQLNYSKNPLIQDFVKSLDAFELSSTYLYHIPGITWFGPFASVLVKSSLLRGYDIRPAETMVKKIGADGVEESQELYAAQAELKLTKAFAPTQIRESIGLFADILKKTRIKVHVRTGVGAWEIFVRDGYVLSDDAATPELEVTHMQDSFQLGWESNLIAGGTFNELVNYSYKLSVMYPLVYNIDTDLSGADLINVENEFLVGAKLSSWASLDYSIKAYRLPFISEDWQIQNGLLITLTASIL